MKILGLDDEKELVKLSALTRTILNTPYYSALLEELKISLESFHIQTHEIEKKKNNYYLYVVFNMIILGNDVELENDDKTHDINVTLKVGEEFELVYPSIPESQIKNSIDNSIDNFLKIYARKELMRSVHSEDMDQLVRTLSIHFEDQMEEKKKLIIKKYTAILDTYFEKADDVIWKIESENVKKRVENFLKIPKALRKRAEEELQIEFIHKT